MSTNRWAKWAIKQIQADANRSADTHLLKLHFPALCKADIHLYLKDESTHPTGSLKHRLARSLFLYGICNGLIGKDTPIVEASSGSTAISEAYFARLLDLPFIAVVPEKTAPRKCEEIEFWGGTCVRVKPASIYEEAANIAREKKGHYMDQFTYAERATDWRGNNNIAETMFEQLAQEKYPDPRYVVMSAGTGGTSATIGRYMHYHPSISEQTQLIVPDPENSVFYDYYKSRDKSLTSSIPSRIEGIGRPRVELSFIPDVVDEMMLVKDAQSIATIHFLERYLGKRVGASTGTNVYAAFSIIHRMMQQGQQGSVVSVICDAGHRYQCTYYNQDWLQQQKLDLKPTLEQLEQFAQTGQF